MKINPQIYLAGKIHKNCWRHLIVPNLRSSTWNDAPINCGEYNYTGPFFVGCDHGCYHGNNSHGNLSLLDGICMSLDATKREVRKRCLDRVSQCDILFAYIESLDCFGTIAEIEHALVKDKFVVVAFAPGVATKFSNDIWFVCCEAQRVEYDVPETNIRQLLETIVKGHNL
jgi:hypothetical protein